MQISDFANIFATSRAIFSLLISSPPFQPNYTMGEGAGEAKTIQSTKRDRGEEMKDPLKGWRFLLWFAVGAFVGLIMVSMLIRDFR